MKTTMELLKLMGSIAANIIIWVAKKLEGGK